MKALLKDFVDSINNYDNFGDYDDVLDYLGTDEKKSRNENTQDFIHDILDRISEDFEHSTLKEIKQNYDRDTAIDSIYEYCDGLIDIYYDDIYKSCEIFSWWVNDAKSQGLMEGDIELYKMIQIGQGQAYTEIASMIVEKLSEYIEEKQA